MGSFVTLAAGPPLGATVLRRASLALRLGAVVAAIAVLAVACAPTEADTEVAAPAEAPNDVVVAWTERVIEKIETYGVSPPVAARMIAYISIAMRQMLAAAPSVEPIEGIDGLPDPVDTDETVSWPASAGAAAAEVASALFVGAETRREFSAALEEDLGALSGSTSRAVLDRSTTVGREFGREVIDWAQSDGYEQLEGEVADGSTDPGGWQPTPPGFSPPLEPLWGELRTFVLGSGDCAVPPPVPYSQRRGSAFREEAMEVYRVAASLTTEEREVARFWNMEPSTGTPAGHWTRILQGVADERGLSLIDHATAQATMSIAVADAFVAGWREKYETDVLRPVTYVRDQIDQTWLPYLVTPPFPEYPSGHSFASASAARVLTGFFGETSFTATSRDGATPRSFDSFDTAAEEAAQSRLYGGVHYPMGIEAGSVLGRCVGSEVLDRLEQGDRS